MDAQGGDGEEDEGREGRSVGSQGPGQDAAAQKVTFVPWIEGPGPKSCNFFFKMYMCQKICQVE